MGGRRRQEDEQRRRFFHAGATSLHGLGLIPAANRYVCPQCLLTYIPEAIDARVLTLEHAPSRRLGGRAITLTCVDCNPRAGSRLEHALVRERQLEDFLRGAPGRWRGRLITADERGSAVTIERAKDRAEIAGLPERSHPDAHKATFGYFERHIGRSDWQFRLRLPGYNHRQAVVGHLRTAYLAAFAKFGYTTVLNPLGARIRAQILAPAREEIRGFLATSTIPDDASARVLVICEEPFPFLAVQMGHRIVMLPWPPSGVDPYDALARTDMSTSVMRGQAMPWPTGMELLLDKATVEQRGPVKVKGNDVACRGGC